VWLGKPFGKKSNEVFPGQFPLLVAISSQVSKMTARILILAVVALPGHTKLIDPDAIPGEFMKEQSSFTL
jgi:hypothetical protein